MNDFVQIPGLAEALADVQVKRSLSFMECNTDICGIKLRPMTVRDYMFLSDGLESPLLSGGIPSPEQLVLFLWFMSASFRPNSPFRAYWFARKCRKIDFVKAVIQVRKYVEEALMDSTGGNPSSTDRPKFSWCTVLIGVLASEFGWGRENIFAMPIAQAFQFFKLARARSNPNAAVFDPTDKIVGKFLRELNSGRTLPGVTTPTADN